ncbi:MAG: uncharacterized protein PWP23_2506 [Candidatus Sumerlaeota bacterium]|nr:uncharacterized protein [Candidatus Sumerlaeota bacterium]
MKVQQTLGMVAAVLASSAVFATTPGQVVINEVGVVADGTDANEFIELYGPASHDLSDCELVLITASNGTAYQTFDLAGQTIPADGFFVISANAATVPNTDLDVTPDENLIQNGDPDAIVLRTKDTGSGNTVIDAVAYFTQYDTTPGTAEPGSLAATDYEGDPTGLGGDDEWNTQTGTSAATPEPTAPFIDASIGRYPDGADTDDNWTDFHTMFVRTPGESNAASVTSTLPITEDFSQATGLGEVWIPAFVDIVLETAATAVPASIPNSPDATTPAEWASIKDNTGGGDAAHLMGLLGDDYKVTAYFFNATTTVQEDAGLMARVTNVENNVAASYDIVEPISTYGDSYYGINIDFLANTAQAVKAYKSTYEKLGTPVAIAADTWVKLAINCNGSDIEFLVDDVAIHTLTGEPVWKGFVGVGYRESDGAGTGTVRANFDALSITAPDPITSSVTDWMTME